MAIESPIASEGLVSVIEVWLDGKFGLQQKSSNLEQIDSIFLRNPPNFGWPKSLDSFDSLRKNTLDGFSITVS